MNLRLGLLTGALLVATSPAQTLARFDPLGPQGSGTPVVAAQSAPGLVVGDLTQTGFVGGWGNTNVWPVGQLGVATPVLDPNQYVTFDVTPTVTVDYASLSYSRLSYLNEGNRAAAVRTSLDNFTADVDTVTGLAPTGTVQIDFDLSSLAATAAPVTFRIYFYDAPTTGLDWVDLVSTSAGGTGLILAGSTSSPIGTAYCAANSNSTGVAGLLGAQGSAAVSANTVALTASQLPLNSFGFFLTSRTQGFIAGPGGSSGNLCLGGSIGRYVGPGQIKNSGAAGAFSLTLDLTRHPTPTGFIVVVAGDTWNFQAWFRDSALGAATSNFTRGLTVTFN